MNWLKGRGLKYALSDPMDKYVQDSFHKSLMKSLRNPVHISLIDYLISGTTHARTRDTLNDRLARIFRSYL